MRHTPPRRQHGAATLAVTLALLAAMLVTLLAANRNLLIELRQSSNQAEAAVAFEAAEAGLDWAVAMLNDDTRIGTDCRAAPIAAQSFRERHLDTTRPSFTPRALRPACVRGATGWICGCPDSGFAAPAAEGPAFALRFESAVQDGRLRLIATGCARFGGECRADGSGRDAAVARHQSLLALLPALAAPPAAALTTRPTDVASERFFASLFGVSKAQWVRQPAVRRLDCRGDCGAAIAVAAEQGATLLALPGDLLLRGPLALGSAERPLAIVAEGSVQLLGAVRLHGVVHAASLSWVGPAATVRGALISDGAATGDASLDLQRDAAVLDALRTRQGSFVRLPGGWRDF